MQEFLVVFVAAVFFLVVVVFVVVVLIVIVVVFFVVVFIVVVFTVVLLSNDDVCDDGDYDDFKEVFIMHHAECREWHKQNRGLTERKKEKQSGRLSPIGYYKYPIGNILFH